MLQSNALIVDASISMRNYVRTILHQELSFGEVHEAQDAEDAFRILDSGRPIDWIFSSLEMPGTSPIALMQTVRCRTNGLRPRFVLMSSNEESVIRGIAIREGAADYLCKPFLPDQLVDIVHRITGLSERRRSERISISGGCEINIGFDTFHHYRAELTDLSMTGCRMKTSKIKSGSGYVGDLATATLQSEDGTTFDLHAQVKRVQFSAACSDPLRSTEIAIEFIALAPQLRHKLEAFIHGCKRQDS